MLKKEIREKITKNSLFLEKYGLNELAWSRKDAQDLIRDIMNDYIGILGSDVYILKNDRLEVLSDNWYFDLVDTEQDFKKSKIKSLDYIKNYDIGNDENIIFSIIFTEKLL